MLFRSETAYGPFLGNPLFPSDGTLHNQKALFQPRLGFAWDLFGNQKSVLRASAGIFNGHQNMLSQVGSITTNGAQQFTIFSKTDFIRLGFGAAPAWPSQVTPSGSGLQPFSGVRVFDKHYANPRIYTANVGFEQEIYPNWAIYTDFTWSKGVHMTSFYNINGDGAFFLGAVNGGYYADDGTFVPAGTFSPELGDVFVTNSRGKSLYRGFTLGMRKRFSQHFQMEWNYTLSEDLDNDSNERDPFNDFRIDPRRPERDYHFSSRDQRHKFNFYTYAELPANVNLNLRFQAHTPQPVTTSTCAADPTFTCRRNSTWKDTAYTSFDWRVMRPFKIGERMSLIPMVEMFNTFNSKNNVNPLTSPALFSFDGFLRQGVGDPRQVQLAVKFAF